MYLETCWKWWWKSSYVECYRYSMLGMCDLGDVGRLRCGMFTMWDVGDIGHCGCGMLGVWDVVDVGYLGCGMLGKWDVGKVRCLGCRLWDVGCLPGCGMLNFKMPFR